MSLAFAFEFIVQFALLRRPKAASEYLLAMLRIAFWVVS
jgi:hypothetical protein